MELIPWEMCFCGSTSFYISKPGKWWKMTCQRCKCERKIISPGVNVEEYDVDIPFGEGVTDKLNTIKEIKVSNKELAPTIKKMEDDLLNRVKKKTIEEAITMGDNKISYEK